MLTFLLFVLLFPTLAYADSAINPAVPAAGSLVQSAPVRDNFAVAVSEITALQNKSSFNNLTVSDLLTAGNNSWVSTIWPNTTQVSQFTSTSTIGAYGIIGATRGSDSDGSLGVLGVAGFADNNNIAALTTTGAWGGYFEADRRANVNSPTHGIEVDVANFGSNVDATPYSMHPNGLTSVYWSGCGGAASGGGTAECSLALGIVPNTQKYRRGIAFENNALEPAIGAGGNGVAVALANGQSLQWSTSTGFSSEIWGNSSGGTTFLCNSQTLPASAITQFNLCDNLSGTSGEVNFINLQEGAAGFDWRIKTGANTASLLASLDGTGNLAISGSLKLANTTVAALPTCNAGAKYQVFAVSDANAPTYGATLSGGGAAVALAVCDGTAWKAH